MLTPRSLPVWGTNIYIHDVEVSNKDECVTVKSPASNMLIENIFCNWSGGCAMGSLGADVGKSLSMPTPAKTWLKYLKTSPTSFTKTSTPGSPTRCS